MYIPLVPTAAEKRMMTDAMIVAAHVCKDMGKAFPKQDPFWSAYLADKYGPVECADLNDLHAWGVYLVLDDAIQLSPDVPSAQVGYVVRHEIAHRLCVGTERYADLNQPHFAEYDWRTFQEIIAELVSLASASQSLYSSMMRLLEYC